MKLLRLLAILFALTSTCALHAQEKGDWRPVSTNARSITGEIFFTGPKLVINFAAFTLAEIRPIAADEARALFDPETEGAGNLYRVEIPAERRFLHKNTLCGSEPTQWAITYVTGKTLHLAFFTEPSIPTITME
ncbi:MAG: hypothetical protein ABI142_13450, partial [Bryocella sp.]